MPNVAVVIAHYDSAGRLPRHLQRLVAHLASMAQRVIFVSTGLHPEAAQQIRQHAEVIVRENVGYDFWSYKVGIEALGDLAKFDKVWLLNSSFITFDPVLFCDRFLGWPGTADLYGLTESTDQGAHVQSYCVAFATRRVLDSGAFATWWTQMTPISERLQVILKYELGMSRHFVAAGFSTGSVFVPESQECVLALMRAIETRNLAVAAGAGTGPVQLTLRDARFLNPTHYVWEGLLERFGVLKLDLVRENLQNMDLRALGPTLERYPGYPQLYADALASSLSSGPT